MSLVFGLGGKSSGGFFFVVIPVLFEFEFAAESLEQQHVSGFAAIETGVSGQIYESPKRGSSIQWLKHFAHALLADLTHFKDCGRPLAVRLDR